MRSGVRLVFDGLQPIELSNQTAGWFNMTRGLLPD